MLLGYGKMWQKGVITVPGGNFVCHGAFIISEDSKMSSLLLISNSFGHTSGLVNWNRAFQMFILFIMCSFVFVYIMCAVYNNNNNNK